MPLERSFFQKAPFFSLAHYKQQIARKINSFDFPLPLILFSCTLLSIFKLDTAGI